MSAAATLIGRARQRARPVRLVARAALRGSARFGDCPVCAVTGKPRSVFVVTGPSLRESTLCVRCRSNARNRALMICIDDVAENWRHQHVLEAGAGGVLSNRLARACANHTASQYLPDVPRGDVRDGTRSEDLEGLTLADESVDLVLTEDVLEHVFRPRVAFTEIARVLAPDGAHVFTVPFHADRRESTVRARLRDDGTVEHLAPPDYHGDPLDPLGVLVVTDFGTDLTDLVDEWSGMTTERVDILAPRKGVLEPCAVFVSRKRLDS